LSFAGGGLRVGDNQSVPCVGQLGCMPPPRTPLCKMYHYPHAGNPGAGVLLSPRQR